MLACGSCRAPAVACHSSSGTPDASSIRTVIIPATPCVPWSASRSAAVRKTAKHTPGSRRRATFPDSAKVNRAESHGELSIMTFTAVASLSLICSRLGDTQTARIVGKTAREWSSTSGSTSEVFPDPVQLQIHRWIGGRGCTSPFGPGSPQRFSRISAPTDSRSSSCHGHRSFQRSHGPGWPNGMASRAKPTRS